MRRRGLIIGIITGVICLIAILSILLASGRANFLANGVNAAMKPVESGIRNVVSLLERAYDYMYNYDLLVEENEALKDTVAEYESVIRDAEELRDENERLHELLELSEKTTSYDWEDAAIISWGASSWSSTFTVDIGTNFGVEPGDPVITERGELVGTVSEVGSTWATVQTIIDTNTSVGAHLGAGISAMAMGSFTLMQEGYLRLSYVPSGEIPVLGDTVTTSGLGERIPKGLTIGTIVEVGLEDTGASYYAVIEPSAELTSLTQVFVVKEFVIKE